MEGDVIETLYKKTTGDKVKELREKKDPIWSQDYLAELAGVSQTTVWRLENNQLKRGVPRQLIEDIARALDVSPEVLEESTIRLDHLPKDILDYIKDPRNLNEVKKAIYPLVVKQLGQTK